MWREKLKELRKICLNSNCDSKAIELINEVWNDIAKMEYDLEDQRKYLGEFDLEPKPINIKK